MVKRLLLLSLVAIALSAQAQYQLQNSGFENWEPVSQKYGYKTYKGNEPYNWNSFITGHIGGALYVSACNDQVSQSDDVRSGVTGSSAYLISKSVAGGIAVAQGNLTTGCINMGSMSATDADGNYNFTNESDAGQCMKFTGRPDQMKVWIKSQTSKTIKIAAYLHEKGYFQDPVEGNANTTKAVLVASATKTPESNNGIWTQYTLDFNYEEGYKDEGNPYYALVSFATCSEPGGGAASDVMWVDDVEMVYNSELESAKYDGNEVTFTNGTADLTTSKTLYDESKLELKSNAYGATIEKDYNSSTGILTITVKGNDISSVASNFHTYTIAFYVPVVVDTKNYTDDLQITINNETGDPLQATITVETLENGNINFSLRNFIMWMNVDGSLEPMPIGNINISNLPLINAGDYNTFAFNDAVFISVGDPGYQMYYDGEYYELEATDWGGPDLGKLTLNMTGKISDQILYVTINIDLTASLRQIVGVQFGYDFKNYILSSQYGTICIPTAATLPEGVNAYSCATVTNNVLDLEGVSSLAANTPYILQKTGLEASYTILTTEKSDAEVYTAGCLNGVLAEKKYAPEGSYVLQNQSGEIGFYLVDSDITVPANRCYLTTTAGVKALVFPDGTQTSISAIQANDEKAVMYDLSGRRVSKATKGIYITNGKKVLVK